MKRPPHNLEDIDYIEGNNVFHYTCNAPKEYTLKRLGILTAGEKYGAHTKEILIIPIRLYKQFGFQITNNKIQLRIVSEQLLAKISHRFD